MNDQILAHLYGGELGPGMVRRVHAGAFREVVRRQEGDPRHRSLAPIRAFLKANEWSSLTRIAAALNRPTNEISSVLTIYARAGGIERRGRRKFYEYRIKG